MQNESGRLEQEFMVVAVDDTDLESIAGSAETLKVTGVLWSDRRIYTDGAHIKAE